MSFQPATFEEAKARFKPLKRTRPRESPPSRGKKSLTHLKTLRKPIRGATKKRKKPTISSLKKKAWKEFSIFIRTRNADAEGFVACVTCGARKLWTAMQAGHFIAGRLNSNLFEERGTHPQCSMCNVVKHGNGPRYYQFMLATYGQEVIDELLAQNDQTKKWLPGELQQICEKYRAINAGNPLTLEQGEQEK